MRHLAAFILLIPLAAQAGIIGYDGAGTNQQGYNSGSPQRLNVTQTYTPAASEEVFELSAYLANCFGGGSKFINAAVYNVTAGLGSSATLVGETAAFNPPSNTEQWYTFTVDPPIALVAGQTYAIAFKNTAGTDCNYYRNWGSRSNELHDALVGTDPYPATWTNTPTTEGWDHRIYLETRAAAPTGPTVQLLRRRGR